MGARISSDHRTAGEREQLLVEQGTLIREGVRWFAAVICIALLVTGAVAVFTTSNSTGAAALITAGVVAGVVAIFANRIRTLEGGGLKVELAAVSKLRAAQQADEAGLPDVAARLRDEARTLLEAAQPLAVQYELLRGSDAPSGDRVSKLERIVRDWGDLARQDPPEPGFVEQVFDTGGPGNRMMALAMMAAVPRLASLRVAMSAIEFPESAFEQFHALRVAKVVAVELPQDGILGLRDLIYRELKAGNFGAERSDRCNLAEHILSMMPKA